MAVSHGLFVCFLLLNCGYIIAALPEQGVRKLRLFTDIGKIYAGISKSMYAGSVLSLDIKCTPGTTMKVAWGMRSALCANEYLDEFITYDVLDREWETIDHELKQTEISVQLVKKINDHIFLKYQTSEQHVWKCAPNGTIRLPNWSAEPFKHLDVKTKQPAAPSSSGSTTGSSDAKSKVQSKPAPGKSSEISKSQTVTEPRPAAGTLSGKKKSGNATTRASGRARRAATPTPRKVKSTSTRLPSTSIRPTTPKPQSRKKVPGALIKVPSDNIYIFIVRITEVSSNITNISLVVKTYGSYGYLSMIDWPLLPFYAVMCAMYALFLIGWSVLCCCYCKDLLRVQYWIGAVILIGFVEESAFLGEYHTVDKTGQSVPGAVIFGELVSAGKRTLSRVLVIIVSVGYGIVKPRLGPTASKVAVVGIIYFIMSSVEGFMRASLHKAKEQTTGMTVFLIVLSVTDALICWWIFTALVNTMRTLRLRRNLVKLSLYRHFTNTLIFAVLASMAFLIWSLVEHKRAQCLTDWRELWVDDAFWHLLFSVILLVVMILWRPSANNQRYAYSALADGADDEAEEPMMNEAFEGVKMRGAKSPSDVSRHSADQTEADLKWIEDNIPSSVADGALPSLLDSEEEIMTTKYELSKMQ